MLPEDEIKQLWEKMILSIWRKSCDTKNRRIKLKLDSKEIPQLYFVNKTKRKKTPDFEVHFTETGQILSTKKTSGAELIRKFVEIAGAERISSLRIPGFSGKEFVSRDGEVFTKTSNLLKVGQVCNIIEKLEIKAKVIELY